MGDYSSRWKNDYIERSERRVSLSGVVKQLRQLEIKVPSDFCETVIKSGYAGPIATTDLKEIVKIAKFWSPYITEEAYEDLIMWMVKRMLKIHAFAINSNPNSEFFIGNRVKRNDTPIMRELVTTVLSTGGNASFIDSPSKFKFES